MRPDKFREYYMLQPDDSVAVFFRSSAADYNRLSQKFGDMLVRAYQIAHLKKLVNIGEIRGLEIQSMRWPNEEFNMLWIGEQQISSYQMRMDIYEELKSQYECILFKENSLILYGAVCSVSISEDQNRPASDSSLINSRKDGKSESEPVIAAEGTPHESLQIRSSQNESSHHKVIDNGSSTSNFASQGNLIYRSQSQNQNQQ